MKAVVGDQVTYVGPSGNYRIWGKVALAYREVSRYSNQRLIKLDTAAGISILADEGQFRPGWLEGTIAQRQEVERFVNERPDLGLIPVQPTEPKWSAFRAWFRKRFFGR